MPALPKQLFDLPDVHALRETVAARMPLPSAATLEDLTMLGSLLKGLSDANLGDLVVRILWKATS